MNYAFIIAVFVLIGIALYKNWDKLRYSFDVKIPAAPKRPGIKYGYYSCKGEQVAETKGHINLLHESQFDGPDKCIQNILDAGVDVCLDVSYQLFEKAGEKNFVRMDAEARLIAFFKKLHDAGALQYVKYIYPIDEPNMTVSSPMQLAEAIATIRRVAPQFAVLNGYKLAVIYAGNSEPMLPELFDVLGIDDYPMKSHILTSKKFKNLLRPGQTAIVVPGGCYGQDPTPFINYAFGHPEVEIVMPFLWFDDDSGNVGSLGIRSGKMRSKYIQAGEQVV